MKNAGYFVTNARGAANVNLLRCNFHLFRAHSVMIIQIYCRKPLPIKSMRASKQLFVDLQS